jgi:hypothetical protein
MKKILASLLLITSIMCSSKLDFNNEQKTKHRYGEKILVLSGDYPR